MNLTDDAEGVNRNVTNRNSKKIIPRRQFTVFNMKDLKKIR